METIGKADEKGQYNRRLNLSKKVEEERNRIFIQKKVSQEKAKKSEAYNQQLYSFVCDWQ